MRVTDHESDMQRYGGGASGSEKLGVVLHVTNNCQPKEEGELGWWWFIEKMERNKREEGSFISSNSFLNCSFTASTLVYFSCSSSRCLDKKPTFFEFNRTIEIIIASFSRP